MVEREEAMVNGLNVSETEHHLAALRPLGEINPEVN